MAEVKLDVKTFHRRAKELLSFWKVTHPAHDAIDFPDLAG